MCKLCVHIPTSPDNQKNNYMNYSKDGVTIAPYLDTRRAKVSGLYPVRIRVTYRRERTYYPTGKDMSREDWGAIFTTKSRTLLAIRKDIESSYTVVRSAADDLLQLGDFSIMALNSRLKGATGSTINTAIKARIERLEDAEHIGNASIYKNVLKGLERFGGTSIGFDVVGVSWVERYADFLRKEGKSATTVAIHLRTLRAIMNEAKRGGAIKESQYPFGRGRCEIQEGEGRKLALTLQQVGSVANYKPVQERARKHRDFWLFMYLCNGINVADFVRLRFRDIVDGEIYYTRQKTARTSRNKKEIKVPVTDQMRKIIEEWGNRPSPDAYIFPILKGGETARELKYKTVRLTTRINTHMTTIGKALGFGKITTYTARHSFATVLKRAGANIAYISESLGHHDLRTTENYLDSFEREERTKHAEILTSW